MLFWISSILIKNKHSVSLTVLHSLQGSAKFAHDKRTADREKTTAFTEMFGTIISPWEVILAVGVAVLSYVLWKRTRRHQAGHISSNVEPTKTSAKGSVPASVNNDDHAEKKKSPADGKDNLAYHAEECEPKSASQQPSPVKIVSAQPRLQPGAGCKRQISDLSALSDFSPSNGKELSEMVLEGLEKSFSNGKAIKDLEKSFHGRDATMERPSTKFDTATDEDKSDQAQDTQPPAAEKRGGQEWRNKLMQDLEDDEEFVLSSSEEDEEEEEEEEGEDEVEEEPEVQKKRAKTDDSTPAINENTNSANALRENSVNSQDVKCGGIPVVVDAGSYEIKAGLAGEFAPTFRFRTVIGKWRSQVGEAYREQYGDILFADEALLSKHSALALKYPIRDGVIEDWNDFESILEYVLSHFPDVDIKDHPLLITEHALVAKKQREKQLEVIMEALHCPMTQFRSQASLSTIAAGSDVALVVNSGHGSTEVVPMYHGYAIQNSVRRVNVGGRHITEHLGLLLLKERGVNFSSVSDQIVLDEMKITYAEIGNDQRGAEPGNQTIQHELPDGNIIELGDEISRCTQPIFSPELIGDSDGLGLVEAIKQSVKSLDPDIRPAMKSSVLLAGGNCRLNGFKKYVEEQLRADEKGGKNSWRVTSCHDLTNCAWIGGSVFADSDTFRGTCVTDDAYFEYGPSIIHRMCF